MERQISYYNQALQQDIMNLPVGLQARYIQVTQRLKNYWETIGIPHCRARRDGLFDLRLKSEEGSQIFYCTLVDNQIVFLHTYVKKSKKTPLKEVDMGLRRMQDMKANHDTSMMTHDEMIKQMLQNPSVKKEYEALELEFVLFDELLQARRRSGLTQLQVAERMGTKESVVAQIESSGSGKTNYPSVAILIKYAEALGCHFDMKLVPH